MASVHDVAAYILLKRGPMSTMKLQKLVYYAQAWHLAWEEIPLFPEPIEAWANGPVVETVYQGHRGRYEIDAPWVHGSPENLTPRQVDVIDAVTNAYGPLTGRQLGILTHSETPWIEARRGLGPTDRSRSVIALDTMQQFYAALDTASDASPIEAIDWNATNSE